MSEVELANQFEGKMLRLIELCDKVTGNNSLLKEYVSNLYNQIDVLQSKLIYIQEQGVEIKFPKLPQYDEDHIIVAREKIMERYKSIE